MGPPKRTARPAAGAARPAASTPAAARKVLRVGVMQRFYPPSRAILVAHDPPASIVAARPDEPAGPRPTESRHGVPWAKAYAVRQAFRPPLGRALRQRGAARGT